MQLSQLSHPCYKKKYFILINSNEHQVFKMNKIRTISLFNVSNKALWQCTSACSYNKNNMHTFNCINSFCFRQFICMCLNYLSMDGKNKKKASCNTLLSSHANRRRPRNKPRTRLYNRATLISIHLQRQGKRTNNDKEPIKLSCKNQTMDPVPKSNFNALWNHNEYSTLIRSHHHIKEHSGKSFDVNAHELILR